MSTTAGITRGYLTSDFLSSPNLLSTTGGLQRGYLTAGYLSTLNLNSTVAGLGTTGYVSTILSSFITLSTGMITTSSALFFDSRNFNSVNTVYVQSTLLYFNNYVVGGSTQLQPQFVTF